jgi:predicted nucleic acid-binding protein
MTSYAYLDSSALVKLVHLEPESHALEKYLKSIAGKVTSVLGTIEMNRTLRRISLEVSDETYVRERLSAISLIEIDNDIARLASSTGPPSLRSLDAIHLATVEYLRKLDPVVVAYDKRLVDAAQLLGFRTASPS